MYRQIEVEQTALDCEITQEFELDIVRVEKSVNGFLDVTLLGKPENLQKYFERIGVEDTEIYFL